MCNRFHEFIFAPATYNNHHYKKGNFNLPTVYLRDQSTMTFFLEKDSLSRRTLLQVGATTLGACALFSLSPLSKVLAENLSQVTFTDFMSLSQPLCGQQVLDPQVGKVLFQALNNSNPDFATLLARYKQWFDQRAQSTRNLVADIKAQQKDLALIPALLTRAWYLGIVGNQAYAYEQALMYPPIKDMVVLPTYARGQPGYWEAKPYPLPAN